MGVPVFFKWLTMRNPKLIRDAVQPNQNQYDSGNPSIDNFYVDMNGLIHPSVNPKDQNIKEPTNFQQQCENIQAYIDKLMNIVRPSKLIYLAVDGVAPRAKMNQQRSRRFRAAMQGEQIIETKTVMLQQYQKMGVSTEQIQLYARKKNFDSNVITPGTIFLNEVCNRVKKYIKKKLQTHRLWKNLIVIFSDANCPGQGQHKIMNFIRQQRASLNYNPNICHCIYGADADLIMLSLATHEPKFYIIREIVITFNDKWCTICGKKGHFFLNCKTATSIDDQLRITQQINAQGIEVNFQFIYIKTIREYLELNFRKCQILFGYNLERIIDDFIFLCFFVGNDFLPHIPCLNIRDGGIDVLLRVYDQSLKQMKDYLTNAGKLNLSSLKIFIDEMKHYQKDLIEQLINKQAFQKQKNALNKINDNNNDNNEIDPHLDLLTSFKNELKKRTNQDNNIDDYSVFGHPIQSYKEKYYREKFKIQPKDFLQLKHNISKSYIEALKWICLYYYEGVPSWSWYYPFHYSPFFTDIEVIGKPFSPFEQLMAVIPPKTYYVLPKCLQQYMLSPESPIADYFPCNFVIDLVGKKFAWLGQVLLPFIDEYRLLKCLGQYKENLSLQDKILNQNGSIVMFFNKYGQFGRNLSMELSIGSTINFECQQHYINGIVSITQNTEDIIGANLIQPNSNVHDIHLKNGIEYNPFEELDDQFITHTDKKAYGGQRFLRVIERVLNTRRIDKKKPFDKEKSERRRTNMECQNQRNGSRQRSRDHQREQKEDGSKYRRHRDGERQSNNRNEKAHFLESNHRRSK